MSGGAPSQSASTSTASTATTHANRRAQRRRRDGETLETSASAIRLLSQGCAGKIWHFHCFDSCLPVLGKDFMMKNIGNLYSASAWCYLFHSFQEQDVG